MGPRKNATPLPHCKTWRKNIYTHLRIEKRSPWPQNGDQVCGQLRAVLARFLWCSNGAAFCRTIKPGADNAGQEQVCYRILAPDFGPKFRSIGVWRVFSMLLINCNAMSEFHTKIQIKSADFREDIWFAPNPQRLHPALGVDLDTVFLRQICIRFLFCYRMCEKHIRTPSVYGPAWRKRLLMCSAGLCG